MDASASIPVHADINKVCGYFLDTKESLFPVNRYRNTSIKYTRLANFDFEASVQWPRANSYVLHPRLRRIVTLEDQGLMNGTQSLKNEVPINIMRSPVTRRKIVTITDNPKITTDFSKTLPIKKQSRVMLNKAVDAVKMPSAKNSNTRSLSKPKDESSIKVNKTNSIIRPKTVRRPESPIVSRSKVKTEQENVKVTRLPGNDQQRISRRESSQTRVQRNKEVHSSPMIKSEVQPARRVPYNSPNIKRKQSLQKPLPTAPLILHDRDSIPSVNETLVITVPLDRKVTNQVQRKLNNKNVIGLESPQYLSGEIETISKSREHRDTERFVGNLLIRHSSEMCTQTNPEPEKMCAETCTDAKEGYEMLRTDTNIAPLKTVVSKMDVTDVKDSSSTFYDCLDIPNLSLRKEIQKNESKENLKSHSLPNLNPPAVKIISKDTGKYVDDKNLCKSASFIIGRATVTYTTRQKIDFHVVGQKDELLPNLCSPLAYPLNVVSVFRKEISKRKEVSQGLNVDNTHEKKDDPTHQPSHNHPSGVQSSHSSYSFSKLIKPSDVISTIRLDDGLTQKDFICERFQRELNFIDSFIESLVYLENCSLSGKGYTATKVHDWVRDSGFDVKSTDYDCFIPKLENGAIADDSETIAAQSLCLLNLLISDEQRRAKNLLFVLKMREDALKDYTKSQIIWLENKKKHENTDISTLKKKQRGALLKLQHECGEMQRMRKALLTLSEKRRLALLKTKKNIELKLNSNVNDILLAKKKIKRNSVDRNNAPLKCFDLSSSGCEEVVVPRAVVSEPILPRHEAPAAVRGAGHVLSAEKSIQTGDSLVEQATTLVPTNIAPENLIGVDGGYLNILFGHLALPQIFSSGKQYEVNEEALKNIVNSTNNGSDFDDNDLERFMGGIKCKTLDKSTSPSTARSLVDELDEYFKGMVEVVQWNTDDDEDSQNVVESGNEQDEGRIECSSTASDQPTPELEEMLWVELKEPVAVDAVDLVPAGPLPVPPGAAEPDIAPPPLPPTSPPMQQCLTHSTSKSNNSVGDVLSTPVTSPASATLPVTVAVAMTKSSLSSAPAHLEAEELRRRELAIEREIKVLEQQQLLAVREIPDKPPPPYTPPVETRVQLPRQFSDESLVDKVLHYMLDPTAESTHNFDTFVKDFCLEMLETVQADQSDKPWDSCNLLPHKPQIDMEELLSKTITEIKEAISVTPTPSAVTGVTSSVGNTGARRCDHVDDILYAEWRRVEPAWTALHSSEAEVKSQLYETIFQQLITETIEQYNDAVLAQDKDPDVETSLSQS